MDLLDDTRQLCPYCGEPADVFVEEAGPPSEEYVEDCSVCCRPWRVTVTRSPAGVEVLLHRDDD